MTNHSVIFGALLLSWTTAATQPLPWTPRSSGTNLKLRSIAANSLSIWVAVGDAGAVLRTTDGGNT